MNIFRYTTECMFGKQRIWKRLLDSGTAHWSKSQLTLHLASEVNRYQQWNSVTDVLYQLESRRT